MSILRPLIALPMLASAVSAQQSPDTTRLTPVVVTATRVSSAQTVTTAAATVLSGESLRARGLTTVGAALREIPGMTVVQTAAAGSETGVFLRGGERDYVQVMIDGVTVNEPGGFFNYANLTLDNVERIEVVRGPTSVLYGSDAVTGVIQIFTRSATGRRSADLRGRGGERGAVDLDGSLAGGDARLAYSLGGGHHASRGVHALNNDFRNDDVSGRVRFAPGARASITLTGRYSDARYHYPTEFHGAPLDSNSYSTERRVVLGLGATYAVSARIDAHLGIGSSRFHSVTDDVAERSDDFGSHFESRSDRRNADARIDVRLAGRSTLSVGADYDWQRTREVVSDPALRDLVDRWSRGAYAQLIGDVGGRVTWSAGGRLEENQRFGRFASLRLGAALVVTSATTLRASGGSAFKEPQFTEILGGCCAISNPALEPEKSTSWEVGVEHRLVGEAVALSATYFDQTFRNMVQYTQVNSTDFQYVNAQSARSTGWELEGRASIPGGTTVRASFSALDANFRATGPTAATRLPRRASRTGSVVVSVPVRARLLVSGDAAYVGRRDDVRFFADFSSRAERLPSYTLAGLAATYILRGGTSRRPEVELQARIDNVLDERYEAVAGFATPRRTGIVGLRIGLGG